MSSDRSGYSHKSSKNPSSPVCKLKSLNELEYIGLLVFLFAHLITLFQDVEVYDKTRGGTSASSPASSIKSGDDKRKQTSTGKSGGKVSDTSQVVQ